MLIEPVVLQQAVAGAFFTISGYHKLFNKTRHAAIVQTLEEDKVPCIRWNQWFVPSVEWLGGAALMFGVFPKVMALLLGAICLVATCVDGLKRVKAWKPLDWADAFDDILYLPEVLYGVMLICILIA